MAVRGAGVRTIQPSTAKGKRDQDRFKRAKLQLEASKRKN